MDGRKQEPVIKYLKGRFHCDFVDTITEPGPNGILAEQSNKDLLKSIFNRLDISINKHGSVGIAVVGHYDCAGNPGDKDKQNIDTKKAVEFLKAKFPNLEVIGLYVSEKYGVEEFTKYSQPDDFA